MKALPALGMLVTIVGVGLSAAVHPPLFGSVSGYLGARWWEHVAHGKSTLLCGGHERMTITGKHFTATDADLTGPSDSALISAGGQCEITLIDCELEAPNVIQAGGTAMIHIIGGKLTATGKAIDIGGDAAVEVSGTSVVGAVESGGHAHLVGIAPQKRTGTIAGDNASAWQKAACDGIPECFTMTAANGPVDVEVTAHLAKDGHVASIALKGTMAPATAACIRNISLEKKILTYDGGPGALVCSLSGTQTSGAQMFSVQQSFVR